MNHKIVVVEKRDYRKEKEKKANSENTHQRALPFNPIMPCYYSRAERAELREIEKRILMRK